MSEIMSRHATLLATNVDLRQQQQRVTDLAEESRYTSKTISLVYAWTPSLKAYESIYETLESRDRICKQGFS